MKGLKPVGVTVVFLLIFAGCNINPNAPAENQFSSSISISNDKNIEVKNDTIDVYLEDAAGSLNKATAAPVATPICGANDTSYNMHYIARIPPVVVEGDTVQANDIIIRNNMAIIAYNIARDPFGGAVQVVDISRPASPEISWELKFARMDVNAVELDANGKTVWFGGGADPDRFGIRSFVGKIDLDNVNAQAIAASINGRPSYAVTGICQKDQYYFVSEGALNGQIEQFDRDFRLLNALVYGDVRDLTSYQGGIIAVAGTTDNGQSQGTVIIASQNAIQSPTLLPIIDFGSDYHKATIEIFEGNIALLGLSEAGFKVLNLLTPVSFISEIPNPVVTTGLLCNTNSVSTDGNLIFVANGEYGIRVLQPKNHNFATIEKIGFYHPGAGSVDPQANRYSANHVAYQQKYLFVAAGASGVDVYYLEGRQSDCSGI